MKRNEWIKYTLNTQDTLYIHEPPNIQDVLNISEAYKTLNIHEI